MEVTINFEDERVRTTVYVKIQAPDSLLLSEVICQELGIVKCHPSVKPLEKQSTLNVKLGLLVLLNCQPDILQLCLVRKVCYI